MSEYEGKYDRRLLARFREVEAENGRLRELLKALAARALGFIASKIADVKRIEELTEAQRDAMQYIKKLEISLLEAVDGYQEYAQYAGDYLQRKHEVAEDIARLRKVVNEEGQSVTQQRKSHG